MISQQCQKSLGEYREPLQGLWCQGRSWRRECIYTIIFLFRSPLHIPVMDLTTPYSSPTFTTLDTVERSSVIKTDGTMHVETLKSSFLMWAKLPVEFSKKTVWNWNCDGSFKVFKRIGCWCAYSVKLTTTYPGDWWCSPHLTTHFKDCFKPPAVVGVNTLFHLLEGWCQGNDLRHCLDNVFGFLLKASSEAPEVL